MGAWILRGRKVTPRLFAQMIYIKKPVMEFETQCGGCGKLLTRRSYNGKPFKCEDCRTERIKQNSLEAYRRKPKVMKCRGCKVHCQ